MPIVDGIFYGRPFFLPRRFIILLSVVIWTIFIVSVGIPQRPAIAKLAADHNIHIPESLNPPSLSPWITRLNPFRSPAHPPPRQANDTNGESSWYSNYLGLLMPFSSAVTLDESRSLLPPVQNRAPIYCYYDSSLAKDDETRAAESELLLTWRRAWWAQGFRPMILSDAEAVNHPYYQRLRLVTTQAQKDNVKPELKLEIMRWLAFESMKGGILADRFLFPMARYDDPMLKFLRAGDYPRLMRWEHLGNAIFAGPRDAVSKVVSDLINDSDFTGADDVVKALPPVAFAIEPSISSLAFYSPQALTQYSIANGGPVATPSELRNLNRIVNGHLHSLWQSSFPGGINVLKPLAPHTSVMVAPALQLAQWLALCPDTPAPQSCPPNLPKCAPCSSRTARMRIYTAHQYDNRTDVYTIATVPHPLTLNMLIPLRERLDARFIRRETLRDQWLTSAIATGDAHRLLKLKEAIAKDELRGRSLWLEAEKFSPELSSPESLRDALKAQVNIDWFFGFEVPQNTTDATELNLESDTRLNGPQSSPEEREKEAIIIVKAKRLGKSSDPEDKRVLQAVEAWHLQDTEAWRFARAFRAREEMERAKFEHEEHKYVGGVGSDAEKRQGRWWDP